MINLEQIRELESKIAKAVDLISVLRKENAVLQATLDKSQKRIEEFEQLIGSFKSDQFEIEKAILSALQKLDSLEDDVADSPKSDEKQAKDETPNNQSLGAKKIAGGSDKDATDSGPQPRLGSAATASASEGKDDRNALLRRQDSIPDGGEGDHDSAEASEDGELDIF